MSSESKSLLIGRETEQEAFLSLFENGDPVAPCVVLTGPPGSGKSHLVYHSFRILERAYGIKWILISCLDSGSQSFSSFGSPKFMFQLILHSIKSRYLPNLSETYLRCDGTAGFLTTICELLKLLNQESGKDSYSKEQISRIMMSLAPLDAHQDRFARFVDLLLTVCFPVCRSARELIHLMKINWPAFEDPVTKGLVAPDDEWGQWKLAQPFLKHSLSTLYLRPPKASSTPQDNVGARSNNLELPYFTRFLLIAAFLASYNPRSADKKFLVKNTGKLSTRQKRQEKFAAHTKTQSTGPRVFPLDRMLAIFNVLVQEDTAKVPFTSLVMSQIACLTSLGLLGTTNQATAVGAGGGLFTVGLSNPMTKASSAADSDPLSNPKYRCLASLEMVKQIAQSVDFDLLAHLTEFCTV